MKTQAMFEAARVLSSRLAAFARETNPQIGHHSDSVSVRSSAAKELQGVAVVVAEKLESLTARPDALEAYLIDYEIRNDTVNMDPHGCDIAAARREAFDAAISRRDERDGFRRNQRGFRERRQADGTWIAY